MLTVLAWLVFVPAVIWNLVFFAVAFATVIESKDRHWFNKRNLRDATITFAFMFVPGVYLFGLF